MNNAFTLNLPAKATAFHLGDLCSNYLLILSGRIKVLTRAENGREVRFTTWPAFLTRITGAGAGRSPPGEKCGLE